MSFRFNQKSLSATPLQYQSDAATSAAFSVERDRSKIPDKYIWDLSHIYPSIELWKAAKQDLLDQISGIDVYRGRLGSSAEVLHGCLALLSDVSKEFTRLYSYASMNSDIDMRDTQYLGMEQEMSSIGSTIASRTAFVEPEILKMERSQIDAFIGEEPKLEIYRHNLYETLRRKEHTGDEREEKIIADASLMADGPNSIYSVFANAEFPYPEVMLSGDRKVKLDRAAFSLLKFDPNREDRNRVFSSYYGRLSEYRRTFGMALASEVKKNLFYMRARKYPSCLHRALDGNNIPVQVYHTLIENANKHLNTFHRYLRLRQRMLGVEQLHHYDLYAPLVEEVDLRYTIEEAQEHVLQSLTPLGNEYLEVSRRCFNERWLDVFPSEGKRSGAYSNGSVYDVHPYILLNHNGKFDDMSTLTHELGHTVHSYFSNKTQPHPTADYSIFVAEVASTFNEALLMHHLLKTITDGSVRLSLLGHYLDGIRATLFRQIQFSEFELKIHEAAERGESLTGDSLSEIYMKVAKHYYAHDQSTCLLGDEIAVEWASVPHFYYNFYVFQYATSLTASSALSEQVLAGDRNARDRYLALLSAGGSDYPIELLKKSGVDMTTSIPFEMTIGKMNRVMDEMESILQSRPTRNGNAAV